MAFSGVSIMSHKVVSWVEIFSVVQEVQKVSHYCYH